jgi:AraC-like DNA-binding protein
MLIMEQFQYEALERVHRLLEERGAALQDGVSNAELCRMAVMTEAGLVAGFKELYGMTPQEVYRAAKFTVIERMLLEGSETIKRISDLAGYAFVPSFYAVWSRRYGCGVAEWVRRRRAK